MPGGVLVRGPDELGDLFVKAHPQVGVEVRVDEQRCKHLRQLAALGLHVRLLDLGAVQVAVRAVNQCSELTVKAHPRIGVEVWIDERRGYQVD